MLTIGLASHLPCITDAMVHPEEGKWAPRLNIRMYRFIDIRQPKAGLNVHSAQKFTHSYICSSSQQNTATENCIPPGSLNRVPASAGVKAGMPPLSSGR